MHLFPVHLLRSLHCCSLSLCPLLWPHKFLRSSIPRKRWCGLTEIHHTFVSRSWNPLTHSTKKDNQCCLNRVGIYNTYPIIQLDISRRVLLHCMHECPIFSKHQWVSRPHLIAESMLDVQTTSALSHLARLVTIYSSKSPWGKTQWGSIRCLWYGTQAWLGTTKVGVGSCSFPPQN